MQNIRAIFLMIFAMIMFTLGDMFIKLISARLPAGELIFLMGSGGAFIFFVIGRLRGESKWSRDIICLPVITRNFGEIVGTAAMVTALTLIPFNILASILQAAPLVMTLGAALFLKEHVGWPRWSAIAVGFVGVLIVIRPGFAGFEVASLLGLVAMLGLSIRDLSSRAVPVHISTIKLSILGSLAIVPVGLAMMAFSGGAAIPNPTEAVQIALAMVLIAAGYFAITSAMRMGDVSVVAPLRYSRLLFALCIGFLVFDETLDVWMLVGSSIIVGSGLFTFARERKHAA